MKSNVGLTIHLKSIRKHSSLIQSNKPFSHCGVAVCTYPFLPTSFWLAFLSKRFPITYLLNIMWHVMLSVHKETTHTFNVQSPYLTARKITKQEQNQGWMEERACGQVVTYSLINILDWFTLLCQKQMCHLPFKDSTCSSAHGFIAACIICHSSLCVVTMALFAQMWRKPVHKMRLITWCTGFVVVL